MDSLIESLHNAKRYLISQQRVKLAVSVQQAINERAALLARAEAADADKHQARLIAQQLYEALRGVEGAAYEEIAREQYRAAAGRKWAGVEKWHAVLDALTAARRAGHVSDGSRPADPVVSEAENHPSGT